MIKLRYPQPEDAERFYEILNSIDSTYFYATIPDSVEMERDNSHSIEFITTTHVLDKLIL